MCGLPAPVLKLEGRLREKPNESAVDFGVSIADAASALRLSKLQAAALPPGWPPETFEAYCKSHNRVVLEARAGAHIAGLIVLQFAADEGEILSLATAESMRRKGLATALIRKGLPIAKSRGIQRLYLEVAEGNAPAIAFYRKSGFHEVGQRKNYYDLQAATAIIMRLDLSASKEFAAAVDHPPRST